MAMNRNEREAALLIEAQRIQIIIRRNQPEPLAASLSRHLRDSLDEPRADPDPRLGAIDRHDLAVLILKRVREQPYPNPFQDGDEAGQRLWMIDLAVSNHNGIAPVLGDILPYPCAVLRGQRSHLQGQAFDGSVGMPVVGVDGL